MDGKKDERKERPPSAMGTKKSTRPPATTQPQSSTGNSEPSKRMKAAMVAPRALLDKEGYLKEGTPLTVASTFNAYKLIYDSCKDKVPSDVRKVLVSFLAILGELAIKNKQEVDPNVEGLAQRLSSKLESTMEKGLTKLSNLVEASLANQKDMQNTSKKLGETAEVIQKASEDVNKNLAAATDTSSKLTTTVSLYKDMLLSTL
jgi:hypothetical protein